MTEPGSVLLDRAQIEQAFTALGDRLVRRGVVADVFIIGGAAMALAYDATRVTRDVDSLFVPHGVVLEEARNVAHDLGLPTAALAPWPVLATLPSGPELSRQNALVAWDTIPGPSQPTLGCTDGQRC